MIDPRVSSLCAEVGIEAIEGTAYPRLGQTRAVNTIRRIIERFGEDHARLVLMTLAETENNRALLDEVCLWTTSDMVRVFSDEIEQDASQWLAYWDSMPVGYLQSVSHGLKGMIKQRDALSGMVYRELRKYYGQQDLEQ
ncbi:hypothetical protein [Rhizobium sp. 11515TR]|uniref:hypothetical protein n=1 Tax=Rhizobium sp. 11515TR TaxID=2028343 RepID=UPI000BA89EDA|nr:hypothetical protein [Rhizobium sp. 11515TR]ASW06286.1 hypothetical protein CKA34_10590 [Rhizobium sp. 11515TR]